MPRFNRMVVNGAISDRNIFRHSVFVQVKCLQATNTKKYLLLKPHRLPCQYKLKEKVGYEFTKEIIRFLKGIRESYSPFTKLSFKNLLLYIMTPLGILELICNYLFKVNLNSISWIKTGRSYLAEILQKSAFAYYGASLGVLLLLFLDLYVINPAFLRNFFPPICFAWGKELEHYEVVKKRREHLWWSVIVTLVLSIIAGVIVEIIINH